MKFRAVLELNGKTATGIQVPDEVVTGLQAGKKPQVKVTIGGYSYRSTVGIMGGRSMIPVSAEHRAGAGIQAGDEVEVALELDTAPRELILPVDFAEELKRVPEAKQVFDSLSYSNKRRHALPIEEAKTAETRQRRIEKTIKSLIEQSGR